MEHERIHTETPKTAIWDRIDILTSLNGVKQELERKNQNLNAGLSYDLIVEKAKGVAFCLRSAKDLFSQSNSKNLTPSLTSLYYGTYNLLSAILIGNVNNSLTLEGIENFSKNGGHGLKSIHKDVTDDLANDEYIYCCDNGFYKELLKSFGYDTGDIVMSRNFRKIGDISGDELYKLISLKDLLSRIPELRNIYTEIFREQPNYINFHANKKYGKTPASCDVKVGNFQNTDFLKAQQINDILGLPENYVFEFKREHESSPEEFKCENILEELIGKDPKYHSPIAVNCTVKPLLGVDDMMLLYFKLFYILSIWTRYRPNLWREICEGKFDQYRSLFTILTDSAERILPNLFLDKFYDRKFVFASHSYWS